MVGGSHSNRTAEMKNATTLAALLSALSFKLAAETRKPVAAGK